MYTEHFGLNEKPFSISPDPRYLYLSQRHADGLAHLLYGISESGGFIQLTGEVGTGKTTLVRSVLRQLPERTEIALILNPHLSPKQFLQAICHELHLPFQQRDTGKMLIDRLNTRLLGLHAENRRVVLIVDEAQTMSPELLEQVRLLTNLETEKQKLLQIILIGQPELREVLSRPYMRQIAQRITGRYHLEPLNAADTAVYVAHRMKVAGGRPDIFSQRAIRKLYRLSGGVPRLINIVADRALLAAYARDESRIGSRLVGRAASEVFGQPRTLRWWPFAAAVLVIAPMLVIGPDGRNIDRGEPAGSLNARLLNADAVTQAADPDSVPPAEPTGAAEPEAPALPTLAELLAMRETGREEATGFLLSLWGIVPSGEATACDEAEAHELRCLSLDGGSLGEIRELKRPVRLELRDHGGRRHHVVVLGLDETHADLWIGGSRNRVAIADLTHFAFGDELLLFRPAIAEESGSLAEGARGPGVVWLRICLEDLGLDGIGSDDPDFFDATLTAAVKAYQGERGLYVDGVVGDRTLVSLQSELGLIGVSLESSEPD
ncbi:MAG TPA: AAA family ATPase [Gammaproteobacteria bacterium]|nr:AAA family ATPase [Gammaproteobacteria bacterium]